MTVMFIAMTSLAFNHATLFWPAGLHYVYCKQDVTAVWSTSSTSICSAAYNPICFLKSSTVFVPDRTLCLHVYMKHEWKGKSTGSELTAYGLRIADAARWDNTTILIFHPSPQEMPL
ncbi:hypothetical protein ABBQ32_005932 [Trebouxia sp. C0010 RCD-2024]